MYGEPSKGLIVCEADVWKTCVMCGDLNKKCSMRNLTPLQLHVFVAYLKFTKVIPEFRNFCSYDNQKSYECYVCRRHIDAPTVTLRNTYAFPPEVAHIDGKCNAEGILLVLKKYLPPPYLNISVKELAGVLPMAAESEDLRNMECSCCSLLEKTRIRLKAIIGTAETIPSSIHLNFEILDEIQEIEHSLDVETKEDTADVKTRIDLDAALEAEEHFLSNFETMKDEEQMLKQQTSMAFTQLPARCQTSTSPPDLSSLNFNFPTHSEPKSSDENQMPYLSPMKKVGTSMMNGSGSRKRKPGTHVPLNPELTIKKNPLSFLTNKLSFSPYNYSQLMIKKYAGAIMNSELVVFSIEDIRKMLPEKNSEIVCKILTTLISVGLIHADVRQLPPNNNLTIVYLKEFRRDRTGELWGLGIIPEHYRQRLIGFAAHANVRAQLNKHKNCLIEMNQDPDMNSLISTILSDSCNSDLAIDFGKNEGPQQKVHSRKTRTPKIEPLQSDVLLD